MAENPKAGDSYGGGCPFARAVNEPNVYRSSDLTYNDYLKVPELLSLQVPQSEPAHHDELLFIIIHQTYELWFKLILHEMDNAIAYMQKGEILRAHHFMKRINEIMRVLVPQIHILETMTPVEFLEFRDRLNPASGFQSMQFREVEFSAGLKDARYLGFFKNRPDLLKELEKRLNGPDLRSVYYDMLRRMGFTLPVDAAAKELTAPDEVRDPVLQALKPIYQEPTRNLPLYLLTESLIDFDSGLSLWREHHVRVVERVIGFKRGTGGSSGSEYLRSTTTKRCFPFLWEVRSHLEKPV